MAKNLIKKSSDFSVLEKRILILAQDQKEKMEIPEMIADQCHQGITWLHVLLMKVTRKNLLALVGLKNLTQDFQINVLRVPAKKDLVLIQKDLRIPILSEIAPDQALMDREDQVLVEDQALEVAAEIVLVEDQAAADQVVEGLVVVRETAEKNGKNFRRCV